MEKFYIVPEGTKLHTDFTNYETCKKELARIANDFMTAYGIGAKIVVPLRDSFGISPTKDDEKMFGSQLCKKEVDGIRFFKKNSALGKEWATKTDGIRFDGMPFLPFYFRNIGWRTWSRLFRLNGVVYCTMESQTENFHPVEDLQEIKASEFWRTIEEYEDAQKNER